MLFTLSVAVKGWVQILQPIVLTFGTLFTALNMDADLLPDFKPIIWKSSDKYVPSEDEDVFVRGKHTELEALDDLLEEKKRDCSDPMTEEDKTNVGNLEKYIA